MSSPALTRAGGLLGNAMLFLWLLLVMVPLLIAVLSAFKSSQAIFADPIGFDPAGFRPGNFAEAWAGPPGGRPLWIYIVNTVLATAASILIGVAVSILAAYGLARSSSRLMAVVNRFFTVLITLPILSILVPIFGLMGALDLRDSVAGISLVYAALMVPPTAILLRPYFAAVPAELIEAARIDGAGELRTFLRIVLPITFPTIIGVIVINIMWVWGELALATVLLISPDAKTIPVGIVAFQGQYDANLGVIFAGLLLASLPLLIIYIVFSRRVTEGMAAGGIK